MTRVSHTRFNQQLTFYDCTLKPIDQRQCLILSHELIIYVYYYIIIICLSSDNQGEFKNHNGLCHIYGRTVR